MKIIGYNEVKGAISESGEAKGVTVRVVIGKHDGADNFSMRIFHIAPGGNTQKHSHDWEQEMFVHSGEGEVYGNSRWNPVKPGDVVFIPNNEEHQARNSGNQPLVIVCLVPSKALDF
jgi:quercetin dioxygenase-like cupin family protein